MRKRTFLFLALAIGASALHAAPQAAIYQVQSRLLQEKHTVFAQIVGGPPVAITADASGRLRGFSLRPGDKVDRGQVVANLQAPSLMGSLSAAQDRLQQDRDDVDILRRRLHLIEQQHQTRLATEDAVLDMTERLRASQSRLAADRTTLSTLTQKMQVKAPVDGRIQAVAVGDGQRVTPGQPIASVRPATGVWLRATLYGQSGAVLTPGTRAQFLPNGDAGPVAVSVVSRFPDPSLAGRWRVILRVPSTMGFYPGQFGKLSLISSQNAYPVVPSNALILDSGAWWVMRQTVDGAEPVKVSLVAQQDGWSWIGSGVKAGDRIVIKGAYELFHHDFSHHYSNPD